MAQSLIFFLAFAIDFSSVVSSEEIKLPQGNNVSVDLLQTLQSAHGVALNQKSQEDLFISLPLVAPNQASDGITVANTTVYISVPPESRARALDINVDRRAVECNFPLTYEGQDPCTGREKEPGFVKCHQPCMFTLDWFVANTQERPENSACLFYTFGLSNKANSFVERHNQFSSDRMLTIWMIWHERYFAWNKNIDNPMRCIIQDDVLPGRRNAVRQGYFERMSDSMAFMCGGRAAVMDENIALGKTGEVYKGGIWEQVEFPRLKMEADHKWKDDAGVNRVCNNIDAIGEFYDFPDKSVWWEDWWTRASGLDWANQATKPFCLQENCNIESLKINSNETTGAEILEGQRLRKRVIDTSIFDRGGKLEIRW